MFVQERKHTPPEAERPEAALQAPVSPWSYTVSVRSLCDFSAKHGDLDRRFTPSATATEGQAGELMVAARRGPGYQRQVALAGVFEGLRVRGRADGFDTTSSSLEEIKTIRGQPQAIPANRRHLHWAQLQTYGALYCRTRGVAEVRLRLVYVDVVSQAETLVEDVCQAAELELAFAQRCRQFLAWAQQEAAHRQARDAGLSCMEFPLAALRPGQRGLAEAVYRATISGRVLLAQAPTGIGKTLGTLYPMLRAMPRQQLDKIAYLTCKTSGRIAALEALQLLRRHIPGGALRVMTLVAREQACEHPDKACHGDACPLARGFYDRLPAARAQAVQAAWLDPVAQRQIALQHAICPYYLGQEMLRWSDVVVGDVHHAFDPKGQLQGLTQALDWRVGLLVDEAHNLVDRTRQMLSASLTLAQIRQAAQLVPPALRPVCDKLLSRAGELVDMGDDYQAHDEMPEAMHDTLVQLNAALGEHFQDRPDARGGLLNFYFDALQLQWCSERLAAPHSFFDVTRGAAASTPHEGDSPGVQATLALRNVTPGAFLKRRWPAFHSTVLFSATLGSQAYQRDLLGLPDNTAWIDVDSPFDPACLQVQVAHRLSTRYPHRQRSLGGVADLMARQIAAHPGNYLAFFSSFAYLEQAADCLAQRWPAVAQWRQARAMTDAARQAFLERFQYAGQGIGFAVLGGAFAEGVDLPGQRLIGAFIATLGLPPPTPVQEQMRLHLDTAFGAGHGYADLLPGLQKVVQAGGRVIRSAQDRGWLWLMDDRYASASVQALLPPGWRLASPAAGTS
ncbi:MAG TPA: ATP-dependent DNA helicase, partial [Rubrivivax sp.]|nr:ATP-dependent DNA helicase [Rubrivivax sp.]